MTVVTAPTWQDGELLSAAKLNQITDSVNAIKGASMAPTAIFVQTGDDKTYYCRRRYRYLHVTWYNTGTPTLTVNVNGNNILITSDHGFIYQNDPLQESDYASYDSIDGAEVTNRRFVLGKHMDEQMSMKSFSLSQLGFAGEGEVLIPKSINRLRIQGGGSRFVHGGASLQEVVIPVIEINKKRRSDVSLVNVDVIQTTSRITSRQPTVSLYQSDPVSEKLQGRDIRVGFYSLSGGAISDLQTFAFDSTEQDGRSREKKVSFILSSEADDVNHQDIVLRLEEPAGKGTSHYRVYKEFRYSLILSFTSDFDDFD